METVWKLLRYIRDRLKEPSTYPAIILILTALGHHLTDEQKNAAIEIGLIVAGLVGAILPDTMKGADNEKTLPPVAK